MIKEILTNPLVLIAMVIAIISILLVAGICFYIKNGKSFASNQLHHNMDIGNAQIIGTREKQDDSFATTINENGIMAIVADGIGGYINGNVASQIAVETYLDEFENVNAFANTSFYFQKAAVLANERIRDEFGEAKGGTTVVAVLIEDNKLHWTSVGDSNIAVYRNNRLITVNRKENVKNWLEDQYLSGAIAREEAMGSPVEKRLVNYVGYDGFKKADESDRPIFLKKGDKVIIYSDGVETLSQIELENILAQRGKAHKIAEDIMTAIENKKVRSKDNATIIVLSVKKG